MVFIRCGADWEKGFAGIWLEVASLKISIVDGR